jgi:metallo-beta-lactamase class B
MKAIQFDIWVASHASQFNLRDKYKPSDVYNPLAFADNKDYIAALNDLQKQYDDKLKKDAVQK